MFFHKMKERLSLREGRWVGSGGGGGGGSGKCNVTLGMVALRH